MALFQLIYMSSLVTEDAAILAAITDVSVRNNRQRNITGMMLHSDGSVLQVLEGDRDAVLETFKSIQLDPRHSGIFVLIEGDIAARNFASWDMGYRDISTLDIGHFPIAAQIFKAHKGEIDRRVQPGEALTILKSFVEDSMNMG